MDYPVKNIDSSYATTRMLVDECSPFYLNSLGKIYPLRIAEGGLRFKGCSKHDHIDKPLITIITVVFNCAAYLESTILSVINQTYDNLEYIIYDGGSTDGTLDIIKKYDEAIDYWVSEPDSGIFDAMNKGIEAASGQWINFMNSGDTFNSPDVIQTIFPINANKIDLIYGDVCLYKGSSTIIVKLLTNKYKINFHAICHQSTFIRKSAQKKFDLNHPLSADHDVIYSLIKANKELYVSVIIAKVLMGGVSSDTKKTRKEKFQISLRHGNYYDYFYAIIAYCYGFIKEKAKQIIMFLFSEKLLLKAQRIKFRIEEKINWP